ncbi:unnamed protein product, partial [Iphiclides podalirius]
MVFPYRKRGFGIAGDWAFIRGWAKLCYRVGAIQAKPNAAGRGIVPNGDPVTHLKADVVHYGVLVGVSPA